MKKFLGTLLIICASLSSWGQISFKYTNLKDALKASAKTGKPIFIDCYTTWCGPCKGLEEYTFSDKALGEYFNKTFTCTHVDMDKETEGLGDKFNVQAYPTLLFVDSKGNLLYKAVGYKEVEELMELARNAQDPVLNFVAQENTLTKNLNTNEGKLKYLNFLVANDLKIPSTLLTAIKTELSLSDITRAEDFENLSQVLRFSDKSTSTILDQTTALKRGEEYEKGKRLLLQVCAGELNALESEDEEVISAKIEEIKSFISTYFPEEKERIAYYDVLKATQTDDINLSLQKMDIYVSNFAGVNDDFIRNYCKFIMRSHAEEKEYMLHIEQYLQTLLKNDRSEMNLLYMAYCQKFLGNKAQAKDYALELRNILAEGGNETEGIDEFIAEL